MSSTQTLPDAGWFRDPARPWTAHRWDGERWTGETSDGRTLPMAATPSAPPDPARRVEIDELPKRSIHVPAGLAPLVGGVLLTLLLLPRVFAGLDELAFGGLPSQALPVWLVVPLAAGIVTTLYGIVTVAVVRAQREGA